MSIAVDYQSSPAPHRERKLRIGNFRNTGSGRPSHIRAMSRYLFVSLAMIGGAICPCDSQQPAQTADICTEEKFREFDFWAGTWRVQDAAGKFAGDNSVSIEQGGCVLVERWRGAG